MRVGDTIHYLRFGNVKLDDQSLGLSDQENVTRQALGRFDITSCHITEQRLSLLVPPPCRFRQSNIYTEYPQIGLCTFFLHGVAGVGTLRKNTPISAVLS